MKNNDENRARLMPWCMALLVSALVAGCGGGGGRDPILGAGVGVRAPTVLSVTPVDQATGVSISAPGISATFSEPVAPVAGNATVTVTCAAPCANATGTVAFNAANTVASFTLTPGTTLSPLTLYTGTVTAATSIATGLPLASPFVWKFTTGAAPIVPPRPTVLSVFPANNATAVPINTATLRATFSEAMVTLTPANLSVTCAAPCTNPVVTGVTMDPTSTIASFALAPNALVPLTKYTATISNATSKVTGLTLAAPFVWSFTTGATADTTLPQVSSTQPATSTPGPTPGAPTNAAITAVFTKDMAPASLTASSFTLSCAAPCVAPSGTVSYAVNSRTGIFTPAAALAAGTTYTATITTAATDLVGNPLAGNQGPPATASNYVWTFTTVGAVAPGNITLKSINPANNANGVCPTSTVNATFNVPGGLRLDPATVNGNTFTLTGPTATTAVTPSSVTLDSATGTIATFTPAAPLTAGVTYTATVKGGANGIKDLAIPADTMVADLVWSFTTGPSTGNCLQPIPLGAAQTFGTFGGTAGMTNQGLLTKINGDIGTTAVSTAVTGFHDAGPGCTYTETPLNIGTVNGLIYTAAPPPTPACPSEGTASTFLTASNAAASALAAYNALVALPPGSDPGAGDLSGLTLAPGVYTSAGGTFMFTNSDLTLDAQGNPNAVFVFQMAKSLTVGGASVAASRNVILINGAQAKNVFWQVGSAATINPAGGGTMVGTIISKAGVVFSTSGSATVLTLNGRALSLGASVTMVNTVINVPAP